MAVARLANLQQGNVTHAQLVGCGLTRHEIAYRVRAGRLFRVHPKVFAVARPPLLPIHHASAAVLACGPGAALSHLGALALWGFTTDWPDHFDVIAPKDRRPHGITVHHHRGLTGADLIHHHGILTTSPARTLLDCVPRLDDRARTRAVNDALHSPYLTQGQLADTRRRFPHHPGAPLLDPFLEQTGITRSPLEDDFRAFCHRHRLPEPHTNPRVGSTIVDATFPGHNLIIELDSWQFHNDRRSFENDRRRDAVNLANGTPTIRITADRLTPAQEDEEADRIRMILNRL